MGSDYAFVVTLRAVLEDERVSHAMHRTYCAVASFADKNKLAWPSQTTIANRAHQSRPNVNAHLKELERLGYISAHKHPKKRVLIYEVIMTPDTGASSSSVEDDPQSETVAEIEGPDPQDRTDECLILRHTNNESVVSEVQESVVSGVQESVVSGGHRREPSEQNQGTPNAQAREEWFESFRDKIWELIPQAKKKGCSKAKLLKAVKKLVSQDPFKTTGETMLLDAVKACYIQNQNNARQGGMYAPAIFNWLVDEVWVEWLPEEKITKPLTEYTIAELWEISEAEERDGVLGDLMVKAFNTYKRTGKRQDWDVAYGPYVPDEEGAPYPLWAYERAGMDPPQSAIDAEQTKKKHFYLRHKREREEQAA